MDELSLALVAGLEDTVEDKADVSTAKEELLVEDETEDEVDKDVDVLVDDRIEDIVCGLVDEPIGGEVEGSVSGLVIEPINDEIEDVVLGLVDEPVDDCEDVGCDAAKELENRVVGVVRGEDNVLDPVGLLDIGEIETADVELDGTRVSEGISDGLTVPVSCTLALHASAAIAPTAT